MFDLVSDDLSKLIKNCNKNFKETYENSTNLSVVELRMLLKTIANIKTVNKFKPKELNEWSENKGVVGVDGSINTIGKSYPHYLTVLKGLAKNTSCRGDIVNHGLFSPLLQKDKMKIFKKIQKDQNSNAQETAGKITSSLLATLEVKVAIESIKQYSPKMIMMDGSLVRYLYQTEEKYEELVELALTNDVLLVGVIEEIGTHKISEELKDNLPVNMQRMYDREMLFGVLNKNEAIIIDSGVSFKPGLNTAFIRPANSPGVVGVDILEQQRNYMENVIRTIYALTPSDSRGIPLWLDIVDKEVRISNKMIEHLVDNHIEPSLKRRLLHSKRMDRIY